MTCPELIHTHITITTPPTTEGAQNPSKNPTLLSIITTTTIFLLKLAANGEIIIITIIIIIIIMGLLVLGPTNKRDLLLEGPSPTGL